MTGDPYQVLGVSHDADAEQIKQAYRQLAKKYHPDLHPGDAEAARRMNEINEAYDLIKNPDAYRQQQRQAYQQQQQTYRQQTYQAYQNAQSGDPFDSFFRDADGRQYWVHFGGYQDPNSQQSQQNGQQNQQNPYGQNPYQWTYHTTRRPRSLLWRLFTVWLAIQLFLSLFGGCAYRLGTDYDEDTYSIPPGSSYSEQYGGSTTTQPSRNTGGFGSIWN